jgi:hypothetical protein
MVTNGTNGTPSAIRLHKREVMRNSLVFLLFAVAAVAATPQKSKTTKTSLTGCVDEHDGQYVLTNDTNLQPIARLQPAAGSAEDNFARHMGEKVTAQGRLSEDKPVPTLTVDSLKTVSQTCASAPETQPK